MLFSLYTSELFDVISKHLPTAHSYADDTGIYLVFNPNDDSDQDAAIAAMEACLCIPANSHALGVSLTPAG